MPTDKQQLQQKIANMEAELAEMKALLTTPKPTINYWQPNVEKRELYYFINQLGCIRKDYANDNSVKRYRIFQTEAEAQKYVDYIKAEETIRKAIAEANQGWWPNWMNGDQKKYTLYFNIKTSTLEIDWFRSYKRNSNFLYIKSEELAQKLAKTYEQEFITYLSY